MIVIAKKTEQKLLLALKKIRKMTPSQRCFYMAFSKTDIPREELFETFLKLLDTIPNAYMAQVYLCQDKDILITMQGFMQKQFLDFLKDLAKELRTENFADIVDIFEIALHWNTLEKLCNSKIAAINEQKEKETEKIQTIESENATLKVLAKLNPDMVATVAKRRDNRINPCILVVDDDQLSRTLVQNVISREYEFLSAKNGQEALMSFVERAPDVVFLDIGLPDINGHNVLECMFQIDPDAYVIMFSSRKDKKNMLRAIRTGSQGFVGKPFTRDKLFHYIEKSPLIQNCKKKEKTHESATV